MAVLLPALAAIVALLAAWLLLRWRRRRVLRLQWPRGLGMRKLHHYAEIYLRSQGFDVVHTAWDRTSYQRPDRAFLLFFHTPGNAIRPIQLDDLAREYQDWKFKYVVTELAVDPQFRLSAAQGGIGIIAPTGLAALADPEHELPPLRPLSASRSRF